jgi:Sigma-70, region 4
MTDEKEPTHDQQRSGRKHTVRARVIAVGRLAQKERRRLALLYPEAQEGYWRPQVRHECEHCPVCQEERDRRQAGEGSDFERLSCGHDAVAMIAHSRPCLFSGCQHNLYLDVQATGGIKVNFPEIEPEEMKESCVLDVADAGGITLERTGELMGITRERIRQIEVRVLDKVISVAPELAELATAWTHPRS